MFSKYEVLLKTSHSEAGNIVEETSEYKKDFGIFTCFLLPIENVIRPAAKYFTFFSAYIYALSSLRVNNHKISHMVDPLSIARAHHD